MHYGPPLSKAFLQIESNFGKEKTALVYRGQKEAREEIARNCAELHIGGWEGDVNAYLYAQHQDDSQEVRDEYAALNRAGAAVQMLHPKAEIGLPFPTELVMQLPGSAQFDPLRYCQALARAVHGNGCGSSLCF